MPHLQTRNVAQHFTLVSRYLLGSLGHAGHTITYGLESTYLCLLHLVLLFLHSLLLLLQCFLILLSQTFRLAHGLLSLLLCQFSLLCSLLLFETFLLLRQLLIVHLLLLLDRHTLLCSGVIPTLSLLGDLYRTDRHGRRTSLTRLRVRHSRLRQIERGDGFGSLGGGVHQLKEKGGESVAELEGRTPRR